MTPGPCYESLITRIEKQIKVEGITIRDEKLALANDGQRLFGLFQLEFPDLPARDHGCVLGVRNSYDKSFAAGLCIGASVFVCDNLSFMGETMITFQRKHTAKLLRDLSWMITEAVAALPQHFARQAETFEVYRGRKLSDADVHDLAIRFYDTGGLNVTQIPALLNEWRNPRHREAKSGKTAWRLFNAATETLKGDLWRLPKRTRAVHEVLDEACGIAKPSEEDANGDVADGQTNRDIAEAATDPGEPERSVSHG